MSVVADNDSDLFKFVQYSQNEFALELSAEGNIYNGEVEFPAYYNDLPVNSGEVMLLKNVFTGITYPDVPEFNNSTYNIIANNGAKIKKNTNLKTIIIKHSGTINYTCKYATVLENVYLYCSSLNSVTLSGNSAGCVYHVINDDVKKALIAAGVAEDNVVLCEEIPTDPTDPPTPSLDYTSLNNALADGEAVDKSMYTETTFNALEAAILSGKAVKDNTNATQTDIDNAVKAIEDAIDGLVYKSADYKAVEDAKAKVPADLSGYTEETVKAVTDAVNVVVYDLDITHQSEVEAWAKAINDAIDGLKEKLDYTEMDTAIAEAEDIIANHSEEYTAESIALLESSLKTAKAYRDMDESIMNQVTIDSVTSNLSNRINNLEKIDIEKFLGDLNTVIADAEALDVSEYTAESYQVLADVIAAAKELNEDTNYQDILAAQTAIKNAVSKLILKPLEEFVKVYKNGEAAILAKGTADFTGATSVRVTFNCASDVSYNEYASIELQAVVSGTESYEKFAGKGDYTTGTNGWTETLALTNPISEGQSYAISAFTYSWSNASDYVYAVSKVEFLDAEGNVISKVTASTQAMAELKEAIAEAEKELNTGKYTVESAAVLTAAIEAANMLTEKSESADIRAAKEAIENAVDALELLVTTGNVTGTIKVSDEDDSTEMTVVAVAADGTEVSKTATSMGSYKIENLEAGDYTLIISGGKYAVRTYEVTVEVGVDIAQDVELNPYGDINGDGKVTTADVGLANAHAKGVKILEGYKFVCANVDINEAEVTTQDVGKINSHVKGVKALW